MAKGTAVTIYGIKNCDTMKKARAWLDQHGVAYDFHDYKSAGIGRGTLEGWARALGWETLLNRSGRTFRGSGRVEREEGDCLDDGAALDDQTAGARCRRQAPRRLQARAIREDVREEPLTGAIR